MPKTLRFGKGTKAKQNEVFPRVTPSRGTRDPITRGASGIDTRRAYPSHNLRLGTTHCASRHQRFASRHDTRRVYPSHDLRPGMTHRASRHQRTASRHDTRRIYPSPDLCLGITHRASGMDVRRVWHRRTVCHPVRHRLSPGQANGVQAGGYMDPRGYPDIASPLRGAQRSTPNFKLQTPNEETTAARGGLTRTRGGATGAAS
jgi:hypothetical protein